MSAAWRGAGAVLRLLGGRTLLLLLLCPQAARSDCSLPPYVPNALPNLEGRTRFPEQSIVTFKCNKGFVKVPGKPDSVVCVRDSEWSQIAEFCNRSCDVPTRLLFASLKQPYNKQSYFPEGTTVEYECRTGYDRDHSLSGNLTCLQNYKWSKPDEFCQKKSCPHPGEITNGHIGIITDISFGASIIFLCNMGYTLVGATSSFCIVVGKNVDWSDPLPECKEKSCPHPGEITNGHIGITDISFGASINFSCNAGYKLVGAASSFCIVVGDNVDWSDPLPECKEKSCPHPGEITNGHIGITDISFGASINFSCNAGYKLVGATSSFCIVVGDNVDWSDPLPECKEKLCPHPGEITNGHIGITDISFGASINFSCNAGYKLVGAASSFCIVVGDNVYWSDPLPECKEKWCPHPGEITNGHIGIITDISFGASIIFSCNMGYKLVGATSSSCIVVDDNVDWSDPLPECKEKSCPHPGEITNGHIGITDISFGASIIFSCNAGYTLVGANSSYCILVEDNVDWSDPLPECKEKSCPHPGEITNGHIGITDISFGASIIFSCNAGYTLVGANSSSCIVVGDNVDWSEPLPECNAYRSPVKESSSNHAEDLGITLVINDCIMRP